LTSITLCALAAIAALQADEPRLLRQPTVHGDSVVFVYGGDLWTAKLDGGIARRLTSHPGGEGWARFSPDGKRLAFVGSYDGNSDVYVMPAEGGEPKRLTYTPEPDRVLGWTPDGKHVSVASTHGAWGGFSPRLWLVPADGGVAVETKLKEIAMGSISPDGKTIAYHRGDSNLFNWRGYRGGTQGRISFFEFATNRFWEMPQGRENSWSPMWVGDDVFFVSDKSQGTVNLFVYDTKTKRTEQLTRYADADIKWPSTDGRHIVYERDGYLFAYDIAAKRVAQLKPRILSDRTSARAQMAPLGGQISGLAISPSGARVAVEARGKLFSLPAKSGDTRELGAHATSRQRQPSWSPDGKSIAFLCDRSGDFDVYMVPQRGGEPTRLTTSGKIRSATWSPDSSKLLLGTAERELVILDVASKTTKRVATARFGGFQGVDWSPCSGWIVYADGVKNLNGALYLYELATGKTSQITDGFYNDYGPSFDLNGKYLYFVSTRTFQPSGDPFEFNMQMGPAARLYAMTLSRDQSNPLRAPDDEEPEAAAPPPAPPAAKPDEKPKEEKKPDEKPKEEKKATQIDIAGIADRALPLPMPARDYPGAIGANNGVFYLDSGKLMRFDMGSRESQELTADPMAFGQWSFNPARTKAAYFVGGVLGIVDLRPGIRSGQGRVGTAEVQAVIDPRHEWRQIFWEAWRWMRDEFYDKNMLGLDWAAIGKRYEQYLPHVVTRGDLNYVLGLMIGELGTGHAYVAGGDAGPPVRPVPVGSLAADFKAESGGLRFAKIYRGRAYDESERGPLAEPGLNVNEGDYLVAIDGTPITAASNPSEFLMGKVGRPVLIEVNSKPGREGARKLTVTPINGDASIRYADWVEGNRKKVEEMSGGRIGYMHVPDTSMSGVVGFIRGYYSQSDKEALVIDERYNGGGMIPTFFVERLARRSKTAFRARHGEDVFFPPQTIDGPMAMLINQYAGSGGDLFPWLFRQAGLGPLIGTRTWGGLVGIQGSAPLVDGGFLTAPAFGLYDFATGKWIAENTGVDPDIEIDLRPDLVAQGRDPQLERAVEYLMKELAKPRPPRKRPDFPRIGR
jgi:tricorn protease